MHKSKLTVHAIIFDMDGVITNTMPDHYRAWKTTLNHIKIPATHKDIYCREGQPGIHTIRELSAQYGKKLNNKKLKQILRRKEDYFKRIVHLRFIAGTRTFIKNLNKEGFHLALVTGTSYQEMCRILPENLRQLFDVIITGGDVRHGKPHPEPYLKSLHMLNLKANNAVAIENAPFGVQSAKAAGLKCLAIETSLPREYLKNADYIFKSIKELRRNINFIRK